jgi:pyruvate,orthophosphate dikinase
VPVRYVYPLDHDHEAPLEDLIELLGGKGAHLNAITRLDDRDLRVPTGFTITTDACRAILGDDQHRWPHDLQEQVQTHLEDLNTTVAWPSGTTSALA